jgi:hypothetical protein
VTNHNESAEAEFDRAERS